MTVENRVIADVREIGSRKVLSDATMTPARRWQVRNLFFTNAKHAAELIGLPELANYRQFPKPRPSQFLEEVGKASTERKDLTQKEAQKVDATWEAFCKDCKVETLRELTPEAIASWGDCLKQAGLGAKSICHYHNRIKTVLNHFRTTGRALDSVRHALD